MYFGPPENAKDAKSRVQQRKAGIASHAKGPLTYDPRGKLHDATQNLSPLQLARRNRIRANAMSLGHAIGLSSDVTSKKQQAKKPDYVKMNKAALKKRQAEKCANDSPANTLKNSLKVRCEKRSSGYGKTRQNAPESNHADETIETIVPLPARPCSRACASPVSTADPRERDFPITASGRDKHSGIVLPRLALAKEARSQYHEQRLAREAAPPDVPSSPLRHPDVDPSAQFPHNHEEQVITGADTTSFITPNPPRKLTAQEQWKQDIQMQIAEKQRAKAAAAAAAAAEDMRLASLHAGHAHHDPWGRPGGGAPPRRSHQPAPPTPKALGVPAFSTAVTGACAVAAPVLSADEKWRMELANQIREKKQRKEQELAELAAEEARLNNTMSRDTQRLKLPHGQVSHTPATVGLESQFRTPEGPRAGTTALMSDVAVSPAREETEKIRMAATQGSITFGSVHGTHDKERQMAETNHREFLRVQMAAAGDIKRQKREAARLAEAKDRERVEREMAELARRHQLEEQKVAEAKAQKLVKAQALVAATEAARALSLKERSERLRSKANNQDSVVRGDDNSQAAHTEDLRQTSNGARGEGGTLGDRIQPRPPSGARTTRKAVQRRSMLPRPTTTAVVPPMTPSVGKDGADETVRSPTNDAPEHPRHRSNDSREHTVDTHVIVNKHVDKHGRSGQHKRTDIVQNSGMDVNDRRSRNRDLHTAPRKSPTRAHRGAGDDVGEVEQTQRQRSLGRREALGEGTRHQTSPDGTAPINRRAQRSQAIAQREESPLPQAARRSDCRTLDEAERPNGRLSRDSRSLRAQRTTEDGRGRAPAVDALRQISKIKAILMAEKRVTEVAINRDLARIRLRHSQASGIY